MTGPSATGSIAAGPTDAPLLETTIGQALDAAALRWGDRDALVVVHQGVRQTWREFADTVDVVARGLMALGVRPGDRVGMWSPNFAEWAYVQFATAKIGAIQVNVNPAYRTHELQYALAQSGCSTLVTFPSFTAPSGAVSPYREMVDEVRPALAQLERVIYAGTQDWTDLLAAADDVTPDELADRAASLTNTEPINIQYTSGTTGSPKGATLSHRNILNNGWFVGEALRYTEEDRVCIPVPYYHCFGMVLGNLACVTHGSAMVVPSATFDPGAVLAAVETERCTSLYGVPTMFVAELAHAELATRDLSSLRTGIMAGSPCPVETMRRVIAEMHMSDVTIAYGMTETSPVSTQTSVDDSVHHRTTTVGRVHPHVEIRLVDPATGDVVPRGTQGELCTRGYSVMLGYWDDPVKTAEAIDADGWMHTGDLATMDADGYVNIVGRSKDMIIRGGENISPREIEEFLHQHPAIADVQVIGVPDDRYGEEVMAWVVPMPGVELTLEDVRDFCRGRIAHFKVPRYVKVVDGFPLTVTGKVRKVEMREQSMAELGLAAVETA
jgi:fatty-acyl-CoA synthase